MSVFSDIAAALDSHLDALSLKTAWENVDFTPPQGVWVRPTLLPGETVQGSMGDDGYNEYAGLYQVSVFTPRGTGRGAALTQADAIAAHFARGTTLTHNALNVRIGVTSRETAQVEPEWYHVPVIVAWRAHAAP